MHYSIAISSSGRLYESHQRLGSSLSRPGCVRSVRKDSEVMDLQVKLVKDTVSAMWHIRKALWYGNSYRELRRWLYLHEWTVGGLWEGEEESNYNICQPGMVLSNCQILPLFPYSTFSFFQLPLLPFQPLAPPPCAALLYLSNLLCLSPAPRSTTSSNFAFSDEKRPWNTWKFRYQLPFPQ